MGASQSGWVQLKGWTLQSALSHPDDNRSRVLLAEPVVQDTLIL